MNLDHILSKKLGLGIAGMWFATQADDITEAVIVCIIAITGLVCQTILDRKKNGPDS